MPPCKECKHSPSRWLHGFAASPTRSYRMNANRSSFNS